ncbi:MAG: putative addiction module component, family [Verrucomicrobia bacterium]|nr:putative addiction module component, family [Verrucomicrobiota bacterium]
MSSAAEKIVSEASALSLEERAEVVHQLLMTLDAEPQEAVDAAWREELARRGAAIDGGTMQGRPASEVFAELRERFP